MTRIPSAQVLAAFSLLSTIIAAGGVPASEFTVFAPGQKAADIESLSEALSPNDSDDIRFAGTLQEALASESNLLVLFLTRNQSRGLRSQSISELRQRKVIGIGYGAAELFGLMGLEIGGGACAHNGLDQNPAIQIEENTLCPKLAGDRLVAFRIPVDELSQAKDKRGGQDYNFAMHIPRNSDATEFVEVISRWPQDKNYAPIVKQGNHVMIGLAAPSIFWTREYRTFFAQLATALAEEKNVPFARAKWSISQPGEYEFDLAKGRSTTELSSRGFYFRFDEPKEFLATLEHRGSSSTMMLFRGENGEHWTRKDGESEEALQIDAEISTEDIRRVGKGYWLLKVTNFDRANTATCKLKIEY